MQGEQRTGMSQKGTTVTPSKSYHSQRVYQSHFQTPLDKNNEYFSNNRSLLANPLLLQNGQAIGNFSSNISQIQEQLN